MPLLEPLRFSIEPLERLALPYAVTGSVAASSYGEPRSTYDVDVVLLLRTDQIQAYREVEKHARDISFMVKETPLDRAFLDAQIARLGLEDTWSACAGGQSL